MAQIPEDDEGHPAKRTKYDFFETVTVLAGLKEHEFAVPKAIACDESKFFQRACTGSWREAMEERVKFPEIDPHTFGVFVGWLHLGTLDFSSSAKGDSLSKVDQEMSNDAYCYVVECIGDSFALGDMLQSPSFCNAVVDELRRLVECVELVPHETTITQLLTKLPQQATIRKLLADYVAFDIEPGLFTECASDYPADFVVEIAKTSVANRDLALSLKKPHARGKCFYHDHTDLSKKCR